MIWLLVALLAVNVAVAALNVYNAARNLRTATEQQATTQAMLDVARANHRYIQTSLDVDAIKMTEAIRGANLRRREQREGNQ